MTSLVLACLLCPGMPTFEPAMLQITAKVLCSAQTWTSAPVISLRQGSVHRMTDSSWPACFA